VRASLFPTERKEAIHFYCASQSPMMGGTFSVTLQRNRFADKTRSKFGFSWTEIVALFNQKPAA
jgi:hypothetical protein